VQELKKDATPEGIARIENIEELLNGIKDFTEGQKEIEGARGALAEFLEDVALATDLDKDTGDEDRVALMTIHLAKGLEFPYVFVVGLEEDLFPSAMSLSTRSDLEEERRLFYVALTRAEKQAYLTYAQSRYRWGKLTDSEPSRFIEEIDGQYLEYLTPTETNYRFKPMIDADIFGDVDKSKLRLMKPQSGTPPKNPEAHTNPNIRKLKPISSAGPGGSQTNYDGQLAPGTEVMHERFGRGIVVQLKGAGADKSAEIKFDVGGLKTLLLRFTKLQIIS
jgi:DNA helicase-2/ATP-dependent DNA helicase PcrA